MAGYTAFHNVPVYTQQLEWACWYISYQMVVAYERARNRGQGLKDPSEVAYTQDLYDKNKGIGSAYPQEREWVAKMLGFGFSYESVSPEGLLDLLSYRPVIYDGARPDGQSTHAVVLIGLTGNTLAINDPAQGRIARDYDLVMGGRLKQIEATPLIYPP
jgi:hypothetical protein